MTPTPEQRELAARAIKTLNGPRYEFLDWGEIEALAALAEWALAELAAREAQNDRDRQTWYEIDRELSR